MASHAPTRAIPYGPYGYTDIQRRMAAVGVLAEGALGGR